MNPELTAYVDLFEGLSDEEVRRSIQGETLEFRAGEILFREGDPVRGFMVLLEGTVQIYRTIRGQRVVINEFTTGMTGGELPLLSGTGHLADGVALTDVRIFAMPPAAFWKMMGECETVRERILRNMSDRAAQLQLVSFQREKLVSLGTMAAGLAHELNNPASAAKRAAQELAESFEVFNRRAASMLQRYTFRDPVTEDYPFETLQLQASEGGKGLSAIEKADREDGFLDWLEELDLEDADEIAPVLAQSGVTLEALQEVGGRLVDREVPNLVRWLASEVEMRELVRDLLSSTRRISELIRAMKAYSYMDNEGEMAPIDLHAGLDNTLAILAHKARLKNVAIRKAYGRELPSITAFGSELNQVWTNLLDNAIGASETGGEIEIRTSLIEDEPRRVLVEVEDHGGGIPEDVRDRIFEPFFTTKDVGEGTGLGLDIAYRIVCRHDGTIDVESRPGRTVFRVELPLVRRGACQVTR